MINAIDMDKIQYASFFAGVGEISDSSGTLAFSGATLNGTVIPTDYREGFIDINVTRPYSVIDIYYTFNSGLPVLNGQTLKDVGFGMDFYFNEPATTVSPDFLNPSNKWELFIFNEFIAGNKLRVHYWIVPMDFLDSSIPVPAFSIGISLKQSVPPFDLS